MKIRFPVFFENEKHQRLAVKNLKVNQMEMDGMRNVIDDIDDSPNFNSMDFNSFGYAIHPHFFSIQ